MPALWFLPASLVGVLLVDQALKALVLEAGGAALPFIGIRPLRTRGTLVERMGLPSWTVPVVWAGALAVVLVVAPVAGWFRGPLARVALGAAFGGAASNTFDVLARRAVVDYLSVGRWPAFNLADVAIMAGVGLALLAG